MKKQNNKQRLFEVIGKLDKTFKPKLNESTIDDKYENVVFMQGEEADEPLDILNNQGEDAALEYLKQWHNPGQHMGSSELGHGSNDNTYEKDGYFMSWNPQLNYIGLDYGLSNMDEEIMSGYTDDESANAFLDKVKGENPEMLTKFLNIVRNKGLDVAKMKYIPFDTEKQKNDEVIALLDPKFPTIDTVYGDDFFEEHNISAYSKTPNFLLKDSDGTWLDIATVYDDSAVNDDRYQKITIGSLKDSSIVKLLKNSLHVLKATDLADNFGHVDYDYYNNILN